MSLIVVLIFVYMNGLFVVVNEFISCIHVHLEHCIAFNYGYHNLVKYVYKL
jgi:hypothetical protein